MAKKIKKYKGGEVYEEEIGDRGRALKKDNANDG